MSSSSPQIVRSGRATPSRSARVPSRASWESCRVTRRCWGSWSAATSGSSPWRVRSTRPRSTAASSQSTTTGSPLLPRPLTPPGSTPDTTVHELWLTSEFLVGGCLFIVVLVLGAVFTRRRLIARGKPLTVCALREPGDRRWRFGLARYGSTGLEWFTLLGFSLRPARRWDRGLLNIGASLPLEPGERPEVLIPVSYTHLTLPT